MRIWEFFFSKREEAASTVNPACSWREFLALILTKHFEVFILKKHGIQQDDGESTEWVQPSQKGQSFS